MQKIISLFVVLIHFTFLKSMAALDTRSDTIDIRHTTIHANITDLTTKVMYNHTTLDVKCLQNTINNLYFDLEAMLIDSIKVNNAITPFSYSSPTLNILLLSTLNINDTAIVDIYFHGIPITDASWGGFYFIGNYAFQMGVGFSAQPHSFGRTWHPCFDNFVERSTYEFYITTTIDKKAMCNGLLLDSTIHPTSVIWHWKLTQNIPSYLASVAICNYVVIKKNLTGINGITEALIACEPADTNNVIGSFAHLQESFTAFENAFGVYQWSRVGYCLVPFSAGAMEHATNIHCGKAYIDGTLNYEAQIVAHELSHHWWGDLVTCSTAGDMWLNEGFASYCEQLHYEHTYGYNTYISSVKQNHYNVLSKAHINDNGYRSVANMDSNYTYGNTVYQKGSDVVHTLRSYLGDNKFFDGLKSFLSNYSFKSINSNTLRDYLSTYTGYNLTDYFQNWIFSPGFTHFSIDSIHTLYQSNVWKTNIFLRQRKLQAPAYYNNIPLELGIYDAQMNKHIYTLNFTGRCVEFQVDLPFNPAMIVIDPDSKISDAITEEITIIKTTGVTNFTQAKARIITQSILSSIDSSLIRIEHSWVPPDRFKINPMNGFVLNDKRYWKVDGINISNLKGLLYFQYNTGSNNSYLDSSWVKNSGDSIRLFYRKDATEDWQFANDSLAAHNNSIGNMYAKEIKTGEYCFGIKRTGYTDLLTTDAPSGGCNIVLSNTSSATLKENSLTVFPNPAKNKIQINGLLKGEYRYKIFTVLGEIISHGSILQKENEINTITLPVLNPNIYFLKIYASLNRLVSTQKIIITE